MRWNVRYASGYVLVRARPNDEDETDEGRRHVGVLGQHDGRLDIRVLVSAHALTAMASMLSHPAHPPVNLWLDLPRDKLSDWDGNDWIDVVEANLAFGSITCGGTRAPDEDSGGPLRRLNQINEWWARQSTLGRVVASLLGIVVVFIIALAVALIADVWPVGQSAYAHAGGWALKLESPTGPPVGAYMYESREQCEESRALAMQQAYHDR